MNGLEFKVQHNVVTSVASPKLSIATFPWMISYFAIHPFLCVWNLCFLLLLPTPRLRFSKIRCFLLTLIVLLCVVPSNILIILILLQLWAEKKGSWIRVTVRCQRKLKDLHIRVELQTAPLCARSKKMVGFWRDVWVEYRV